MFTSKSFLFCLPALFSLQTFATELLFIERHDSNFVNMNQPAVTLQELIDRNHTAILDSLSPQYKQLSDWNDYNTDCTPLNRFDLCSTAHVSTHVSFINSNEVEQDWYVTAQGAASFDRHSKIRKDAYQNALKKAKFACVGDVIGEGTILSEREYEGEIGNTCILDVRFQCKK